MRPIIQIPALVLIFASTAMAKRIAPQEVAPVTTDKALEKDIQDVFIKSLSFDKNHNLLIMSDEKGRVFVLNLETKKVTQDGKSAAMK